MIEIPRSKLLHNPEVARRAEVLFAQGVGAPTIAEILKREFDLEVNTQTIYNYFNKVGDMTHAIVEADEELKKQYKERAERALNLFDICIEELESIIANTEKDHVKILAMNASAKFIELRAKLAGGMQPTQVNKTVNLNYTDFGPKVSKTVNTWIEQKKFACRKCGGHEVELTA